MPRSFSGLPPAPRRHISPSSLLLLLLLLLSPTYICRGEGEKREGGERPTFLPTASNGKHFVQFRNPSFFFFLPSLSWQFVTATRESKRERERGVGKRNSTIPLIFGNVYMLFALPCRLEFACVPISFIFLAFCRRPLPRSREVKGPEHPLQPQGTQSTYGTHDFYYLRRSRQVLELWELFLSLLVVVVVGVFWFSVELGFIQVSCCP